VKSAVRSIRTAFWSVVNFVTNPPTVAPETSNETRGLVNLIEGRQYDSATPEVLHPSKLHFLVPSELLYDLGHPLEPLSHNTLGGYGADTSPQSVRYPFKGLRMRLSPGIHHIDRVETLP
jgi:hypothetical protein